MKFICRDGCDLGMTPKTITIIIILLLAGCTDPYQECYLRELPQAQKSLGLVQLQLKFEEDLAWSRRVQDFYDKAKVLFRLLEEAEPTLPKHNIEYPVTPELTEDWEEELEAQRKRLDKY